MRQVARINGKENEVEIGRLEPVRRSATPPTAAALFGGSLARRTLLLSAVWFFLSLGYYGVFVWLPGIFVTQGFGFVRGYDYLVLLALAQVPGYMLAAYLLERVGRRATLALFLFASAIACMMFALATTPTLITVGSMLLSFFALGGLGRALRLYARGLPDRGARHGHGLDGGDGAGGGHLGPDFGRLFARHLVAPGAAHLRSKLAHRGRGKLAYA